MSKETEENFVTCPACFKQVFYRALIKLEDDTEASCCCYCFVKQEEKGWQEDLVEGWSGL